MFSLGILNRVNYFLNELKMSSLISDESNMYGNVYTENLRPVK